MGPRPSPVLRIIPSAWAKLLFMAKAGSTEVAGFGITDDPSDPLLVTDFMLVKQEATEASFEFDPTGLAEYMEERVAEGLSPNEFMRIWVHTHPGGPDPSGTDWETFGKILGQCDWSVMFILGATGIPKAIIQFTAGPGGCFDLPVTIAWDEEFGPSEEESWQEEYDRLVTQKTYAYPQSTPYTSGVYQIHQTAGGMRVWESTARKKGIVCDYCKGKIREGDKIFRCGSFYYCTKECADEDWELLEKASEQLAAKDPIAKELAATEKKEAQALLPTN